jgi:voltage-gated potassium channel
MKRFWITRRSGIDINLLPPVLALLALVAVGSVLVYFAEVHHGRIESLWDAVWWSVVTITTVGYGDVVPSTVLGRVVGMFVMLSGISVISLLTATISSVFVAQRIRESQGLQQIKLKGHTIICGWNQKLDGLLETLNRSSLDRSSMGSARRKDGVVLINEILPARMEEVLSGYENLNLKYINGDYTKEPTLARANLKEAVAVIILPDMSLTSVPRDDKTLPAALAIKSMNRDVKVYAHIIDRENLSHLRRADVDDVIVSDEHVGYLLASDISSPGIAQTIQTLLSPEKGTSLKRMQMPPGFVGKKFQEIQEYFKSQQNSIIIGFVAQEESVKIADILSSDYTAIDTFIEKKFRAAGLDLKEKGGLRLNLNPPLDYVVQEKEDAIVIG